MSRFIYGFLFVVSAVLFLVAQNVTVIPSVSAEKKVEWVLTALGAAMTANAVLWFRASKKKKPGKQSPSINLEEPNQSSQPTPRRG